ncbi:hypothetical protein Q9451_30525 [Pseudomonas sp. NY8896]
MKRTIEGLALAGWHLLSQALEAVRAVNQAESTGASPEEVRRLKLLADSLYEAATDYQLLLSGDFKPPTH